MRFDGKVAIVTGGGSGIGKATVELMAREGAGVLIADYAPQGEQVAESLKEQGLKVEYLRVDVRNEEQVSGMVKKAVDLWGRLDILVANAGIGETAPADQLALADWERMININLTGVFLCAKHAVPAMRASGGGAIVNTASILGHVGFADATAYSAAKAGVVNLTRVLALSYAKERIRANSVAPGFIRTPMVLEGPVKDQLDGLAALHPLGRLGEPEEVAAAIAFLASDAASFVTGVSLLVDGGYTAQ